MRIALTQRTNSLPDRGETLDCIDQAWTRFLTRCDIDFFLVPNDHLDPVGYVKNLGGNGLILSGGGDVSSNIRTRDGLPATSPETKAPSVNRDRTESALLQASLENAWPVLGVCRGMQVINLFHGGSLVKVDGHVASTHALTSVAGSCSFNLPRQVNSFHDFAVTLEGLGKGLIPQAFAGDYVEAFAHADYRHLGIMWHPERNLVFVDEDVTMFREFFNFRQRNQ
jgi:gamma-glutamyl-gamma-aminobutyrate hydrolase PuuD